MDDAKGVVLVVDDNESTRLLVEDTLEEEGYSVYTAADGQQGLKLAHQFHPDVIVLDVMMPGMNGYEVCQRIRQDWQLGDTRVIMLTARAFTDDRIRGLKEAGADDYLTKPFSNDELVERVGKLWSRKKEKDTLVKTISLAEHDAEIGILSAGIAHDFNNILAGMMTYQMMQSSLESIWNKLTAEQQEAMAGEFDEIRQILNEMHVSVATGETICRNLISFVRGGVEHVRRVQALNNIFEVPLGIFERKFKSHGVEVMMDIAEEPVAVDCNFPAMQRVALNLITNAFHAMADSPAKKLSLRLWKDADEARFSVADNGSGIAPEVKEKMFERYFTTKGDHGSGIGLSTVWRIVESHSGRIDFESEEGKGTEFTVVLPLATEKR